jgi:hypothetical protein
MGLEGDFRNPMPASFCLLLFSFFFFSFLPPFLSSPPFLKCPPFPYDGPDAGESSLSLSVCVYLRGIRETR